MEEQYFGVSMDPEKILKIFTVPFAVTTQAAAKDGLQKENGKTYYYVNGEKVRDTWGTAGGYCYYFGKNGVAYTGHKKIGKNWYYFDKNCRMAGNRVIKIRDKRYEYGNFTVCTKKEKGVEKITRVTYLVSMPVVYDLKCS